MPVIIKTNKANDDEKSEYNMKIDIEKKLSLKKDAFLSLEKEQTFTDGWKNLKKSQAPKDITQWFFLLSIGEKDAAMYVADSFARSLGTKTDEDTQILLVDLAYVIGQKLGDLECIRVMNEDGGEHPSQKLNDCADLCVKLMEINKKEISAQVANNIPLKTGMMIGYAKQFDALVKQELKVSFLDSIGPYDEAPVFFAMVGHLEISPDSTNFNFLNNTNYNDYHYNSNEEHKEYAADYHENNDQELAGITQESACCIIS